MSSTCPLTLGKRRPPGPSGLAIPQSCRCTYVYETAPTGRSRQSRDARATPQQIPVRGFGPSQTLPYGHESRAKIGLARRTFHSSGICCQAQASIRTGYLPNKNFCLARLPSRALALVHAGRLPQAAGVPQGSPPHFSDRGHSDRRFCLRGPPADNEEQNSRTTREHYQVKT